MIQKMNIDISIFLRSDGAQSQMSYLCDYITNKSDQCTPYGRPT